MSKRCDSTVAFYSDTDAEAIKRIKCDLEAWSQDKKGYSKLSDYFLALIGAEELVEKLHLEFSSITYNLPQYIEIAMHTTDLPPCGFFDVVAHHYGVEYVFIAEEPCTGLFINTDMKGRFLLPNKYRVTFLYDRSYGGTPYEEMLEDAEGYPACFKTEAEIVDFFKLYGFKVESYGDIESIINPDFICIDVFERVYVTRQ
ncbi:MAG: hypothetical protein J1E98_00330 [Lachnospiraceae bacterium]|nr:hypothetical protein [Lachnospiraceae bacterium]